MKRLGIKRFENFSAIKKGATCLLTFLLVTSFILPPSFAAVSKVYTVRLPEESANVKERWKGEDDRVVIQIQDAHGNITAQKNMASVIEALVERNDVSLIGVEGASNEIKAPIMRAFQSQEAKEVGTNWLIQDGLFGGAEKALVTSEDEFDLVGMEDPELFRKNYRSFYGTQLKRENIIEQIDEIEDLLNSLKEPIFNEELFKFNQYVDAWVKEEMEFVQYVEELSHAIYETKFNTDEFLHYSAFYETISLKMQVPDSALEKEMAEIHEAITIELNVDETGSKKRSKIKEKYNDIYTKFQNKELSEKDYIEFAKIVAPQLNIDFETFPYLKKQLKYLRAFSRLDMAEVLKEIEELTYGVQLKLTRSDEEKELVARDHYIKKLSKLSSLKATNEDVVGFNENTTQFSYGYFAGYLKKACEKLGRDCPVSGNEESFNKILKYIAHFYRGAKLRDKVLVDNLLAEMKEKRQTMAGLVTGGFHTEGVKAELKRRGISYMVVTPKIDQQAGTDLYLQKMMGGLFAISPQVMGAINMIGLEGGEGVRIRAIQEFINSSVYVDVAAEEVGGQVSDQELREAVAEAIQDLTNQFLAANPLANQPGVGFRVLVDKETSQVATRDSELGGQISSAFNMMQQVASRNDQIGFNRSATAADVREGELSIIITNEENQGQYEGSANPVIVIDDLKAFHSQLLKLLGFLSQEQPNIADLGLFLETTDAEKQIFRLTNSEEFKEKVKQAVMDKTTALFA